MKVKYRDVVVSLAVFAGLLVMLVSVDLRVRSHFASLLSSSDGIAPWADRLAALGDAIVSAARYHSIEHAPLMVFAAVSVALVVLMVRS